MQFFLNFRYSVYGTEITEIVSQFYYRSNAHQKQWGCSKLCSSPNQILTKPVAFSVSFQSDWDNHN